MKRTALKRGKVRLKRTVFVQGKPKITREWLQVRRFVEGRANGKCEVLCNSGCQVRGTQAHHRLIRAQGGSDDPANLYWVCAACHDYLHAHPSESYEKGWLLRSGE